MKRALFFMLIWFAIASNLKLDANAEAVIIPPDIIQSCEYWGNEYGISPELLQSIAWQETRCRPNLENGSCKGLCQINIYVHKAKMKELGITDIYDADQNIKLCAGILRDLFEENEDLYFVLQAFNGGNKGIQLYNDGIYTKYAKNVSERIYTLEQLHRK